MMTSSKLVCRQMFWRMLTICHFVNQWVQGTVLQKMIKVFIGMNILMALHSLPDLDAYWSMNDRLHVDGIAKIMPKHRYKTINQYLHLADNARASARGEPNYDPF